MTLLNTYGALPLQYSMPLRHGAVLKVGRQGRVLNQAALVLSLFLPWAMFSVIYGIMSFNLHYRHPVLCWGANLCGLFIVVVSGAYAFGRAQREQMELQRQESWHPFLCISLCVAWAAATVLGDVNFYENSVRFYEHRNLQLYPQLDVALTRGEMVADAGSVLFTDGHRLDFSKQMAFRSETTYCVVPITNLPSDQGNGTGKLQTYDFWAVGTNCCENPARDFQCGEYNNRNAQAGLRLLAEGDQPFFRLAVQQAEAAYDIRADHPLFFHWTQDPMREITSHKDDSMRSFVAGVIGFFLWQCSLVAVAGLVFAKRVGDYAQADP